MKKLLLSFATVALIAPAAFAQDGGRADSRVTLNRIRFGAYIAPNVSWMKPTATKDGNYTVKSDGSKVGFTYGLMAEYFFARNYGLVSGLQVNSTGGKQTSTIITKPGSGPYVNKATFDYRIQYLEIPLALKLRTDDINGFRFFGQLGATLGINIGKKASYEVNYNRGSGNDTIAQGDKIKLEGSLTIAPIMLQMNIGAGAEYPINNKLSAYFGVFFNNGFTPDATSPSRFNSASLGYDGEFADAKTRLNNVSLRLGLFF